MGVKDRPQCYFDVELNREPVGRIVFQLFSDVCPKTSKNFLCLCTGERGTGKTTGKKLCFKGSTFHRVVKNFMVQGGDFTEGNGRGGESIYGGYFEDENFILKHDRAFLLSMANRGKDTNGSQFFITTKMAPHLDDVHVVFGLVISGFEVIKRIEGLKTDSASRPYADVRVIDCGQLITKSANDVLKGKRKRTSCSADSSLSSSSQNSSVESASESGEKHRHRRHKRHAKSKLLKKRRRETKRGSRNARVPSGQKSPVDGEMGEEEEDGETEEDGEKEPCVKREKPVVRPEEIPPVPENRFLLRRDVPAQEEKPDATEEEVSALPHDLKPAVTKSGRKIKGRGTMRYHTPPRSKSRSASEEEQRSSETPPHWKEEMQRTKTYQPPSVERWSKGDRWDDRSNSPWSKSPECSSDHSSERSSQHHQLKKEKKKAKHKKAKKRKHAKRHKSTKSKPKDSSLSEGERSLSSDRRSKVSSHQDRKYRSLSRSPSIHRHVPRKQSSGRRRHSSPSSRDSRSYSRSYTPSPSRSRGKFRSSSRSRSLSRSRSRSLSRSKSRTESQSRSRSRSRYKSRSREKNKSRSSRKLANFTEQKPKVLVQVSAKEAETKATPVPATTPAPESVPVIPMSDSPPPSRWKPGQKPWKSSYVRVEPVKTKSTPASLAPTDQATSRVAEKESASSTSQKGHTDVPDREMDHGHKSNRHERRSHGGSSRSRSYSRSRTRSRSRGRSKGRSPAQCDSRSSSYSRSSSHDSHRKGSGKKKSGNKGWKQYYSSLKRIRNVDKYVKVPEAQSHLSESEDGRGVHSPGIRHNGSKGQSTVEPLETVGSQAMGRKSHKSNTSLTLEEHNNTSEWDSDGEKLGKKNSTNNLKSSKQGTRAGGIPERRLVALAGWDSESDSERGPTKMAAAELKRVSEKEEGEASSESEHEALSHRKTSKAASKALLPTSPVNTSSLLKEIPNRVIEAERPKSRKKSKRKHKHKRRTSGKSASHRSKGKEKRTKRKHHKLKETFHWQPPMEFGEEDEEEDSQKEKQTKQKHVAVKDGLNRVARGRLGKSPCVDNEEKREKSPTSSSNKNGSIQTMCTVEDEGETTKKLSAKQSIHANPKYTVPQNHTANKMDANNSRLPKIPDQPETLDDMEICTPEHDTQETVTEPPGPQALSNNTPETAIKSTAPPTNNDHGDVLPLLHIKEQQSSNTVDPVMLVSGQQEQIGPVKVPGPVADLKWKPLEGLSALQAESLSPVATKRTRPQEHKAGNNQAVRMEIKSKSRVRPGSLFDEVRKTARLNQRPRNQDSSSEERSLPAAGEKSGSLGHSPRKSRSASASSHRSPRSRGRSPSYSRSRSRSRTSSYSSRSRSRGRRRYGRRRSHSHSSSYRSRSRTDSRSPSRSRSHNRHRRARSDSYDSDSSQSRSTSSRRGHRRSDSYRSSDRRSRSSRSSSRSTSSPRSRGRSSRYS